MNNFKTYMLLAALTALLIVIGGALAGRAGMVIAMGFAAVMNFSAYWFSDQIVLSLYKAQPIHQSHVIYKLVEQLAYKARIPTPAVYIIDDMSPNAFATGRNPQNASIAVTEGLLRLLNQQELEGVLAHEMAHIIHRDTLTSTITATIAGAISGIANMFMWMNMFGHHDEESAVHPLVGVLMMIFAPVAASMIQMAISRSREYEADRGGAELCGDPQALANALIKIEQYSQGGVFRQAETHPASAHLFIINPLRGEKISELFSTHPLTQERVRRLMEMSPHRTSGWF